MAARVLVLWYAESMSEPSESEKSPRVFTSPSRTRVFLLAGLAAIGTLIAFFIFIATAFPIMVRVAPLLVMATATVGLLYLAVRSGQRVVLDENCLLVSREKKEIRIAWHQFLSGNVTWEMAYRPFGQEIVIKVDSGGKKRTIALTRLFGIGLPVSEIAALAYSKLATITLAKGRSVAAEQLYKSALALCEKALGAEHPETATILENYALMLNKKKRHAEAEKMEARAQTIREKQAQANPQK